MAKVKQLGHLVLRANDIVISNPTISFSITDVPLGIQNEFFFFMKIKWD